MNNQKNQYEEYPNRPIIIKLKENSVKKLMRPEIMIDLAPLVFADLTEGIAENSELFERLKAEKEKYSALSQDKTGNLDYGVWVFYPADEKFVRFAPMFWHRLTLISRNSLLLTDPEMKMKYGNTLSAHQGFAVSTHILIKRTPIITCPCQLIINSRGSHLH